MNEADSFLIATKMKGSVPPGFRRAEGGLIVPEEVSREREVWCRSEWKVLERATKLLQSRGVRLLLGCINVECRKKPLERIRSLDGGITLRCEHKDRVFVANLK